MRIEDLDRERCRPEHADGLQRVLEAFGFEWDGTVSFQTDRIDFYEAALKHLRDAGLCYPCGCSRASLGAAADPAAEPVYPGTCRDRPTGGQGAHALRFRISAGEPPVHVEDLLQGTVSQDCRRDAGDFVIRRRDGHFAYHLAVVVDDELQGITEVVRGADLFSSTPRQVLLQRALGYRRPLYAHLPLLVEPDGQKLAKSRRAVALDPARAGAQLWKALEWLAQEPPAELAGATVTELWAWATAHWRPERLSGCRERRLP